MPVVAFLAEEPQAERSSNEVDLKCNGPLASLGFGLRRGIWNN